MDGRSLFRNSSLKRDKKNMLYKHTLGIYRIIIVIVMIYTHTHIWKSIRLSTVTALSRFRFRVNSTDFKISEI